MLIRHLIATDAADFRTIRLEGPRQQPEAFDEEVQLSVADFAARLKDSAILVGFDTAGTLQGIIGLTQGRMAKCRHIATIWAVHIRPSARGTGLAARLLDAT